MLRSSTKWNFMVDRSPTPGDRRVELGLAERGKNPLPSRFCLRNRHLVDISYLPRDRVALPGSSSTTRPRATSQPSFVDSAIAKALRPFRSELKAANASTTFDSAAVRGPQQTQGSSAESVVRSEKRPDVEFAR